MRKLLLCILLLAGQTVANAAVEQLVVTLKTGTQVVFQLRSAPVVSFMGNYVRVSSSNLSGSYSFSNITEMHYVVPEVPAGVAQVSEDALYIRQTDKNTYDFQGIKGGERVEVFCLDGTKTLQLAPTADGRATVSLDGLAAGAYIIKVSGRDAWKVVKK